MSEIFQVDSSSFQVMDVSASLIAAVGSTIDFSLTSTTGSFTGSFKGDGSSITNVSASFIVAGANTT